MLEHRPAEPYLSIIVVVFNMTREAPRTLFTLSPKYQGVPPDYYEVLVIDNGSIPPLGRDRVSALSENFEYVYLEPGNASPAAALNHGVSFARGHRLGLLIDGARMLSPGVLQYAIRVFRSYSNPVTSTLAFHLGPDHQRKSVLEGYNRDVEDSLLEKIDWRRNGYRLFEISSFAGSSRYGWFGPLSESNALFMGRRVFEELGGAGEAFDLPGGGMLNLDLYRRALEHAGTELVTLLGEGSFHQLHDGAMTGGPSVDRQHMDRMVAAQYREIRGEEYRRPLVRTDYLGHIPAWAQRGVEESFGRWQRFLSGQPGARVRYEHSRTAPNPLRGGVEQRTMIILGMHRSGTSVLAGSLQECGLALGDVATKAPHNPKGNRENRAVMLMQEDLLETNGGSWDSPPDQVMWGDLHRAVRDLFILQFKDEAVWGFKDPRTLLTLDGWLEALPGAELVGVFRHPAAVALSLGRRNGMPTERAVALWSLYNQRLLDLHRSESFPLVEFKLDGENFRKVLRKLTRQLDLPRGGRETSFFDESLRSSSGAAVAVSDEALALHEELRRRAIQ